jgi:8-amino-7-oxononanoate synthase
MGARALSTAMLNFTSALYLGFQHPSESLTPWSQFTTGFPAALGSPRAAVRAGHAIARLQMCEYGVLGSSTFPMFWDLFGMIAGRNVKVYVDAELYPIARWGVERAAARGIPISEFAHYDAQALRDRLRSAGQNRKRPVVVTDGFCPDCGRAAPLSEYLECVRSAGGCLVVDDTQALGIFGCTPGADAPYGRGGGGMLAHQKIGGPDVVVISSLAKGFGVPVAVLSGSRCAGKEFEAKSETRMHCSPPALPVIRAAERALRINHKDGNQLRLRLAKLVTRFRQRAESKGLRFIGGLFPVQTLVSASEEGTRRLHAGLRGQGVLAVLRRSLQGNEIRLSFVITARHTPESIDRAIDALVKSNRAALHS